MEPMVQVQEPYYILATEPRADEQTRVLKHGESFAVLDRTGAVPPTGRGEMGLYHGGTRFLSRFELLVAGRRPLLLSSTATQDNTLIVDLTNPDLPGDRTGLALRRDTVHVCTAGFLWQGAYYLQLRVRNYALEAIDLALTLLFAADFADIFEVRGTARQRRGQLCEPEVAGDEVRLGYRGLDGVARHTRLAFSPRPDETAAGRAELRLSLRPYAERIWQVTVSFEADGEAPRARDFREALARSRRVLHARRDGRPRIRTSNAHFDEWLYRSWTDLDMMITDTREGPYPYAGIPWYSTVFGRDGLITALETLWLEPRLARGVLGFLAATQATEDDPERDAEPGKIVHEMRHGEMAALGEVPFGRYYGSVDATPLFVLLAGDYFERTGDLDFLTSIWGNVERALAWIDDHGDVDGDGFVEYRRRSPHGLLVQGWKDSADAVFHAGGSLAEGPIALCEVQAYVYAARRGAARIAAALGDAERARRLEATAEALRERFERTFWLEEIGTYALALDGAKRPCAVRASNAGHCLFAGIAGAERARRVAGVLLGEGSFSGWGIRTLDSAEARYNPMSYHNGSIWPHDNALIAAGLARCGLMRPAMRVLDGLFDASVFVDLHRLPELFCGFHRRSHEGPTLYPVACSPQAWAAGAVFLLLQSCLGLTVDAPARQIRLRRPELPEALESVAVTGLRVGDATLDMTLERHGRDVGVVLERREGEIEVVVLK
jgi:glycogen debranching enzyme